MNKKNIPVVNVGISLLILIFMTLSLLTFSVLSLENAVADRRLSRKMAEHTSSYYAAVSGCRNSWRSRCARLRMGDCRPAHSFPLRRRFQTDSSWWSR